MMRALALGLLLMCACAKEEQVFVRFQGQPGGALVYVDDRFIGRLEQLQARGLKIPAGEYRLTVEEVGYFPHDELMVVQKGRTMRVRVVLTPIPD